MILRLDVADVPASFLPVTRIQGIHRLTVRSAGQFHQQVFRGEADRDSWFRELPVWFGSDRTLAFSPKINIFNGDNRPGAVIAEMSYQQLGRQRRL